MTPSEEQMLNQRITKLNLMVNSLTNQLHSAFAMIAIMAKHQEIPSILESVDQKLKELELLQQNQATPRG